MDRLRLLRKKIIFRFIFTLPPNRCSSTIGGAFICIIISKNGIKKALEHQRFNF